jgi:formylglycine-generating enzyme required for sulfatase activity
MKNKVFALALSSLFILATTGFAQAAEKTYTNSIGVEFVLIPAGSFVMGADKNEKKAWNVEKAGDAETPQHKVSIGKSFYLGKYEVTQTQWTAVMGSNPSHFKGQNNPVERVSWDDAQEFINRLNQKEGHTRYRLPTEAEWEYAVRAGTTSTYFFGDDADQLGSYAWKGNSGDTTHPVGQKQPNAWGLYDMYGNVWEWVQDWYGEEYYSGSPSIDPRGPSSGSSRVVRGGGWYCSAADCRSAERRGNSPGYRSDILGFRLALSTE